MKTSSHILPFDLKNKMGDFLLFCLILSQLIALVPEVRRVMSVHCIPSVTIGLNNSCRK